MENQVAEEPKTHSDKSLYLKNDDYVTGKSASGNRTFNSGDSVAKAVEGLDIDALLKVASKLTGRNDLEGKYDHLNIGMQSMNLRNVIRAYLKKNPDDEDKFIRLVG